MKKSKRVRSLILALVMALVLLPAGAFAADSDFVIDENGVLTKYNGSGGEIVIPDGVVAIAGKAFERWKITETVTSITFPDTLRYIDGNAFSSSIKEDVKTLTFPENVLVGESAFFGFENLTQVVAPASAVFAHNAINRETPFCKAHEGDEFFLLGGTLQEYRGNAADLVIPEGVRCIDGAVEVQLSNREDLRSVTFPNSMKTWAKDYYEGFILPMEKAGYNDFSHEILGQFGVFSYKDDFNIQTELINFPEYVNDFKKTLDSKAIEARIMESRDSAVIKRYLAGGEYSEIARKMLTWVDPVVPSKQNETITAIANRIVAEAGAVTDYEKAKAICYWIAENVKYDAKTVASIEGHSPEDYAPENHGSLSLKPVEILTVPGTTTVCDGYSNVTEFLLAAEGIPSRKVTGKTRRYLHAWNEVFVDGYWVVVDTTGMACFGRDENGLWGQYKVDGGDFDFGWRAYSMADRTFTVIPAAEQDTPSDWAQFEIRDGFAAKLIPYDMAGDYRSNITRQEFCRLMMVLLEQAQGVKGEVPAENPFTDTADENVLAAYKLGIVKGTGPNTFNPDGSITRQEAAVMLTNTAKVLGLSSQNGETFSDGDQIADWAKEGIAFVSGLTDSVSGGKVMGGTGGAFAPMGSYTREQAYATALRLFHCAQ